MKPKAVTGVLVNSERLATQKEHPIRRERHAEQRAQREWTQSLTNIVCKSTKVHLCGSCTNASARGYCQHDLVVLSLNISSGGKSLLSSTNRAETL